MKTRLLIFLMFVYGLASCEQSQISTNTENQTNPETPSEQGEDEHTGGYEPTMSMQLVKFTDEQFREYILAEQIGDGPVCMRGKTPPVVEELIVGTIPYSVKLPNGYWLVDWRWGNSFIYRPSNVLLSYKWETLTHWSQTWDMPENPLPFAEYIEDAGGVYRRVLDTHLGLNLEESRDSYIYEIPSIYATGYVSAQDIPEIEKEWYFNYIQVEDSLHQIYTQRLIEVINNGDFDKVYKTHE